MAKFWNFIFFQAGWFACVLGAANKQVLWAVLATLAYIAFTIWHDHAPKRALRLLGKVLAYGIVADTIIMHLGYLDFQDDWPSPYFSPLWMWVLWVLVGGTINGSLSWLRDKPVLGFILGAICGPMSYEAGIRMGAGGWGAGSQTMGFILVGLIWAVSFFQFAGLSVVLGLGTAMVYPTFLSAIATHTHPLDRAESLGIFRLWRDSGYAVGALLTGVLSTYFSYSISIASIAGLTVLSAVIVWRRMRC